MAFIVFGAFCHLRCGRLVVRRHFLEHGEFFDVRRGRRIQLSLAGLATIAARVRYAKAVDD